MRVWTWRRSSSGAPGAGSLLGGRYRLGEILGEGATGQVFDAHDALTNRLVAVKLLRAELASNRAVAMRFRREARSLLSLDHPHIVKMLDAGRAPDGRPFLVMERLAGSSLAELAKGHCLPIDRAVAIVLQVLDAIGHAHRRGVLHRDLKPRNIVLHDTADQRDFVKVCDFGMAKALLDAPKRAPGDSTLSTGLGALCGTPAYMAPEQVCNESPDQRTDLYAIGVLLYELVTGDVPFRASSPVAVLSRQLTQAPEPPSARRPDGSISRALEAIILRALAKDRDQRPPTASAFAEELRLALADSSPAVAHGVFPAEEETLVPPTRVPPPAKPPRRPERRLVGAGLAALVAVVAWQVAASSAARRRETTALPRAAGAAATTAPPIAAVAPPVARSSARPAVAAAVKPAALSRRAGRRPDERRPDEQRARSPVAAPEVSPEGIEPLLQEADRYLDDGRITDSCRLLEAARGRFEREPAFHRSLGRCLMRLGRAAEAKNHLRRYLELAPEADDAAFVHGIVD